MFFPNFIHFCADDSEDFDSLLRHFLLKSAGGKLSGFILGIAHRFLIAWWVNLSKKGPLRVSISRSVYLSNNICSCWKLPFDFEERTASFSSFIISIIFREVSSLHIYVLGKKYMKITIVFSKIYSLLRWWFWRFRFFAQTFFAEKRRR